MKVEEPEQETRTARSEPTESKIAAAINLEDLDKEEEKGIKAEAD